MQIRLDFNTFTIAGPSTATATIGKIIGGSISPGGGLLATTATQCLTDTFTMTGVAGAVPPTICGTNTGYHGNLSLRSQYLLQYVSLIKKYNFASFQFFEKM